MHRLPLNFVLASLTTLCAAGGLACSDNEPGARPGTAGGSSGASAGLPPATAEGGAGGAAVAGTSSVAGSPSGGVENLGGAGGALPAPNAELVVDPAELIFSGVQLTSSTPQRVSLKNPGSAPVLVSSAVLDVDAPGTASFELVSGPEAGAQIEAGAETDVQVRFRPTGVAFFQSRVLIKTSVPLAETFVSLFGLGAKGLEGENEPLLKPVLDTLGFAVDVGGAGILSTTTPLLGEEVQAFRFKAAGAAEVELTPVARYSPKEPIPYGYYVEAEETQLGVIESDQFQTLNPTTEPGTKPSFAAAALEFGIYTVSKTHTTYTDDTKNAGNATVHAVRTYPLKDRQGASIANAYLVCFEEAANGDYQDYVFTLTNVVPIAR